MIYGIQKLSLVDYPKYPAFVLFLGGCNFLCPFCHNESIVHKRDQEQKLEDVIQQIEMRIGFINAIVVTGGEPTLYGKRLITLLQRLRQFPLKIKLDTNGSHPELLQEILNLGFVDYVAMDIKNTFDKYEMTAGVPVDSEKIKKSIEIIENSDIEYEFRMTINKKMHTEKDILEVSQYMKHKDHFFLQPYRYNEHQLVNSSFGEYTEQEIEQLENKIHVLAHI